MCCNIQPSCPRHPSGSASTLQPAAVSLTAESRSSTPREHASVASDALSHTIRRRCTTYHASWQPGMAALILLCTLAMVLQPCCSAWIPAGWEAALEDLRVADIPTILHQSSSSSAVPEQYKPLQASWHRLHPGWEFKQWNDTGNLALITNHYPELLTHYKELKTAAMKSEFSCYLYMYHFGGVYVDLSLECLRPISGLLTGHSAVLGRMGSNISQPHAIPTSFMASSPKHPFWQFVITKSLMAQQVQLATFNGSYWGAERITGSALLQQAVRAYYQYQLSAIPSRAGRLTVLPQGTIYPVDWQHLTDLESGQLNATAATDLAWTSHCLTGAKDFDRNLCKDAVALQVPWAHTVMYWPQSLGKELTKQLGTA